MTSEVWADIPGYSGYQASNLGRVRSPTRTVNARGGKSALRKGKILTPIPKRRKGTSYLQVSLVPLGGRRVEVLVHRLVLLAFLGPPKSTELQVRHLDGNSHNNNLNNLAWGTAKENHDDSKRLGTSVSGERHPMAKTDWKTVGQIKKALMLRQMPKADIAKVFGVSPSIVYAISYGKTWREE